MSIINIDVARAHLRLDPDYPAQQVQPYLDAAEDAARQFLNRRIYADQAALDSAIAAVPAQIAAAREAYEDALEAADALSDDTASQMAREHAQRVWRAAQDEATEIYRGIVLNDQIRAAILLVLANLFENRGDDGKLPPLSMAAQSLLFPFRVGLGV